MTYYYNRTTKRKIFRMQTIQEEETITTTSTTSSGGSSSQEQVYLKLLRKVIQYGEVKTDRTGVGTLSLFGEQLRFNIQQTVPLLTTKKMAWKSIIKELLWFMKGQTNSLLLEQQGVKIWKDNSSREFLDNRGLNHLPVGDIGAGYGFQWRHFGAEYVNGQTDYTGCGFDQLEYIVDLLQHEPNSRRIFMSAWNPFDLEKMALPPCHVSCQFYVSQGQFLSCHMYQRSVDCGLGLPFNIFSYTVLTYILAKKCGYTPLELIVSTGDTHVYLNHVTSLMKQLDNVPYPFPQLIVSDGVATKDFKDLTMDDFSLQNYQSHASIEMQMCV